MTDPLPPSAALPLREGEHTLPDSDGFSVPLTEGDERERHCRESRGSLTTTFCAKPPQRQYLFNVGPTVRPAGGTPASPASLEGRSDGPPTSNNVGPTVRPTGGTPASPASLEGRSDGPPTLSQQLQFLKTRFGRQDMASSSMHYEVLPRGEEAATSLGRHYVVRNVYPHDYFHGKVRLGRFSCTDLQRLITLMREKGSVPDRNAILFLDTETTGMQGGAGMCPFLVGVGYFVDDDFHMLQYFVRDFDEEPSMLCALGKLLEQFRLIVTYNGAAFDIPLLETRFTLARRDSPLDGMSHLDLLTSARRLWRNGHGSCRLIALERELLSFLRGPDVPGAMIPRAYFDFLHHGSSALLQGVFTHNVYDVVSLAALTVCACD